MICRLRRQVASRHQHFGAFDEPEMTDPQGSTAETPDLADEAREWEVAPTFLPRPPEPLPGTFSEATVISRPPLRASRKSSVARLLIATAFAAGITGVGYQWSQRLGRSSPTTGSEARQSTGAPFSLRAAWRDVARHPVSDAMPTEPSSTSVISVLETAAPPPPGRPESRPAHPPTSPAALLAERMARAATAEAAGSENIPLQEGVESVAQPQPPAPATAPMGADPGPMARTEQSASNRTPPSRAAVPASVAKQATASRPMPKVERVPGMVGLGGPRLRSDRETAPPIDQSRRLSPPAPEPTPPKVQAIAVPPPAHRPAPQLTVPQNPTASRIGRQLRRPYRRTTASSPPIKGPGELPTTDMSIFRRLERTMP